jgi:hypothetical protein
MFGQTGKKLTLPGTMRIVLDFVVGPKIGKYQFGFDVAWSIIPWKSEGRNLKPGGNNGN